MNVPIRLRTDLGFRRIKVRRQHELGHFRRPLNTLSIVSGPTHPPLVSSTLPDFFERELLERFASRPALVCKKEGYRFHGGPTASRNLGRTDCLAWDFEEFNYHISSMARGLVTLGVKKGDRVGVVMGNNSAYAILQWACASIGAILVTVNPAYRTNELISTLKLVGVSTLVTVPQIRTSRYAVDLAKAIPALRSSKPGAINVEEIPTLRNLVIVNDLENSVDYENIIDGLSCTIDFRELFAWNEGIHEGDTIKQAREDMGVNDVINLQFTSGTTGLPKAVSLTHHNLLNNGLSIGRCMRLSEEDATSHLCSTALMSPVSFPLQKEQGSYDQTRLVLGNLAAWSHGACIVYPNPIFDPPSIVDAVTQERCTALHGVPTHFLGVLAEVDKRKQAGETVDTSRLRTGIAAGSPIPIELMRRLISQLNLVDLTNAYGMTETSPVSFQTTPDDPILMRTDTVGKIHAHVKAKIVDENGEIVPIGVPGEICVSGYNLQKGYWEDDEQTASVMKRHSDDPETLWMHTGDTGILDEQGYLKVVGRIKDIIIRGGENLFPVQIENRLHFNPSIREAAVVAVPDTQYGEVVGAFVERQPNSLKISKEEVRQWVSEGMNPQNSPVWVWFIGEEGVYPELPKTASGKVQKHILREWAKELVGKRLGKVQV